MTEAVAAVALGGCLCLTLSTIFKIWLKKGSNFDTLIGYAGAGLAGELLAVLALVIAYTTRVVFKNSLHCSLGLSACFHSWPGKRQRGVMPLNLCKH